MKKAFSLMEIILVIVIISILAMFVVSKFFNSSSFAKNAKVKSEIALIRNAISKKITSYKLLNIGDLQTLDSANSQKEGSLLFKNILEFPLLSTSGIKKEIGKWIKMSSNNYRVYISQGEYLDFKFENNSFVCKSEIEVCASFE